MLELIVMVVGSYVITSERSPVIGEDSANFCGWMGVAWAGWRIPTAVFSVY
jgi:hypothetical protein